MSGNELVADHRKARQSKLENLVLELTTMPCRPGSCDEVLQQLWDFTVDYRSSVLFGAILQVEAHKKTRKNP